MAGRLALDPLWTELERLLLPVFTRYRGRIAAVPVSVKADRTLLTDADLAVQKLISDAIRAQEPGAVIIAEEDERTSLRREVAASDGRVWVIDPIDGTAQFIRSEAREFCSVVCLLEAWQLASAFILAPELGPGRSPLTMTADTPGRCVRANGVSAPFAAARPATHQISVTRSSGSPARPIDAVAQRSGFGMKTRTTSQSLDMLRTAVDLGGLTDVALGSFDLFCRRDQKVWDGLAGLCFGAAAGLRSCAEDGSPLPLGPSLLSEAEPVFPSTVMGRPEAVAWFVDATASSPSAAARPGTACRPSDEGKPRAAAP
jgi:3'(2'), 5'-bisphosphate nucleotidase